MSLPSASSPRLPSSGEQIRVLHVITRMVKGGAQENTLATVAGIHGGGWSSALITGPALGAEGSLEPECQAAGVRPLHVPELVREISPGQDLAALRRLTALFRKERPHLVHTHTSKAGILGRIAARRAGVPAVVHTPHGHVFHSYAGGLKTRLFVQAERSCARMADRLIALTATELREHLELGVGAPGQWTTIHSGVDLAPFVDSAAAREGVRAELGIPPEARVIGTVGRLVPVKGQEYLLGALSHLGSAASGLHLLLVGDGPLYDPLVAQAREQGCRVVVHGPTPLQSTSELPHSHTAPHSPTVHFLGLRRDVPRLMAAMDLFALPSLNEGMGRVLVEAMAAELPCVASRVSGIPDVVEEGVTGLLTTPQDARALAGALAELLPQPARAREMGRAGRRRVVPAFGVERMLEELEALYREVLLEKGIGPPPRSREASPSVTPVVDEAKEDVLCRS